MMIPWDRLLTRMLYVAVFVGGFELLVYELPHRFNRILSLIPLAASLVVIYLNDTSGLLMTLLRYILFALVYTGWSLLFLRINHRYALYLSVFFTILMGVWFSIVQIVLTLLHVQNQVLLILLTGICRIFSVLIIKRCWIQVDASRSITLHEMTLSLFPAATCFLANLLLFEYMGGSFGVFPAVGYLPVSLLALFFGLSALIVLIHSESYFQMSALKRESEMAQRQLEEQYQLFLREQEANERVRALRHDIQNHLHTIEKMAASNDAATIRQYVGDLQEETVRTESASITGNATLDALLSAKEPIFQKNGIRFENYLLMKNIDVFNPMEICTLFANAIDNAVEALIADQVEDPYIRLSGGVIHDNLVVKIENPYHHTLQPGQAHFQSTKKIARPHGYGLMNIERIIQTHQGTVTYKTDNNIFTMVWMIPLTM